MARGNQRDKAREKNQAKLASQKKGNGMSGSQQAANNLNVAAIMQEKQRIAGEKKAAEEKEKAEAEGKKRAEAEEKQKAEAEKKKKAEAEAEAETGES